MKDHFKPSHRLTSHKDHNFLWVFLLFCILTLVLCLPSSLLATPDKPPHKIRLIFVQGDSYTDFQRVFQGFVSGLERQHLLKNGNVPIPTDTTSVEKMWSWVRENSTSEQIEFLADGFYSGEYNEERMQNITKEIQERLNTRQDVDVILSYGTFAGQHISKLKTNVPIIFASITDAVAANIVPAISDSGKDNHVAIILPDMQMRTIAIFHDTFHFNKMGIVYDDSPSGRDSIGLSEIERVAKELKIELVHCKTSFAGQNLEQASTTLANCHRKLVKDGAEAIFLTTNISITAQYAQKIFEPIEQAKLPSFSQSGSADVKLGALMSISESNIFDEGVYSATLLSQIMQGRKPRSLSQIFSPFLGLAINIHTAARIGWQPTLETLLAIDTFYMRPAW